VVNSTLDIILNHYKQYFKQILHFYTENIPSLGIETKPNEYNYNGIFRDGKKHDNNI